MCSDVIPSQRICSLQEFDSELINADLAKLSDEQWIKHVNHSNYDGDWSVIALNTRKEHLNRHPIIQCFSIERGDDWAELPVLESLGTVSKLLEQIPFTRKSIRLMRLDPGANIKEHQDLGLSLEYGEARFHVPLQCDDKVVFVSDGKALKMLEGELWYINADAPHSVQNNGDVSRINLVVDCSLTLDEWQAFIKRFL